MSYLTRAVGAIKLASKAHAPTIMVVSGVVTMAAGAVVGAKQTLRVEDELAKHIPALEKINDGLALGLPNYSKSDAQGDRFKVYARVGADLGKLYAVPVVLFVGGAGLVFGGHHIMLKRNATLAIAFTGLKSSFDAYRSRVKEHLGHDVDQALMHGAFVEESAMRGDGSTETIATRDWDASREDPYNRVFAQDTSHQWQDDLGVNKSFVAQQQRFANVRLGLQGHLYLSDVYKSLGFPETDISRVVGWKVMTLEDGSRSIPHVDFGIDTPMPDDWKYNKKNEIYLDFNCQGLIVGGKVQKALEQA